MKKLLEDWSMINYEQKQLEIVKPRSPSPPQRNQKTPRPRMKSHDIIDLYQVQELFEFDSEII